MKRSGSVRGLRDQLRRLVVTPADFEMFLLDHFPKEVHSRFNLATADRTAVENLLLELIPSEDLLDALEDWADRTNQRLLISDELEMDAEGRHELARMRRQPLPRSGLIDRVRTACELWERSNKNKGLRIQRLTPRGLLCVFHVSYEEDGFPYSYALGVSELSPTAETLSEFQRIIAFRQVSVSMPAVLVCGGDKPSSEVLARAHADHIRVCSVDSYELLFDNLQESVQGQVERLDGSGQYPSSLYVPQRGELSTAISFRFGEPIDPVRERLLTLLRGDGAQFVLILGEFGLGKTFLMYELVRELAKTGGPPWPVLCELRNIEKKQTLDALLAWQMHETGLRPIAPDRFRHLARLGKLILFFDGFDELALRTTYERATEHLETLLHAVEGRAKVVLTSRTQHFQSDRQIKTALAEKLERVPSSIVRLTKFTPDQIQKYLDNRLGPTKAKRRYSLIQKVQNLLGLSENPRMLGFIAALDEKRLQAVRKQDGVISAADLYRLILDEWLHFEVKRVEQAGLSLSVAQLRHAATQLAHVLWKRSERSASLDELEAGARAALDVVGQARKPGSVPLSPEEALHQVGSGSLLVRDSEGRFSFLHQSILEWLVASEAAVTLRQAGDDPVLDCGEMSPLMAEFFIDLLGKESPQSEPRAVGWVTTRLDADGVTPGADWSKRNALRVAARLKTAVPVLQARKLANQDLRGESFVGANLSFSDLSHSLLQSVPLTGARLRHTNLRGAQLQDADLRGCDLRDADLSNANLRRARLMGADLRGAQLANTRMERAKLLACRFDEAAAKPPFVSPLVHQSLTMGHSGSLAVSWPAELVATAMGQNIGLWDLASGQLVQILSGHQGSVLNVALSADGTTLVSGAEDSTVRIWDARTGECRSSLTGHLGSVWSVALSADGTTLVSGAEDSTVRIWDARTGECRSSLTGHLGSVWSVALSADGTTLVSGAEDSTVRIWDARTGECRSSLTGHLGSVWSVALSADGTTLVSGAEDSTVRIWDARTGECRSSLTGHLGSVWSVALSADGTTLASGSDDRTVRIWDARTGECRTSLTGHQGSVWSVALSADGTTLASGADDRTVRIWDARTGECRTSLTGHQGSVLSVALSADGTTLASGADDSTVRIWDARTGECRTSLTGHQGRVLSVALSADGTTLASGASDSTVRIWDARTGECRTSLTGHLGRVWNVALSADGTTLASGSDNRTVRIWDARTGECRSSLTGHLGRVWNVALSADGTTLASGSDDRTVRIWDARTGECRSSLTGHQGRVLSVALSADGTTLASGSADRTVRIWDARTGECRSSLTGHPGWVRSLALSADGTTLVSGAEDSTVRIWDARTGECRSSLTGHLGRVLSVALSADGTTVASGADDRTVRIWDARTGECRSSLTGHLGRVLSVALSADGTTVASGADDRTVRIWDQAKNQCLATLAAGPNGWVMFAADGRYKSVGNPREIAAHSIGRCRYELATTRPDGSIDEPGELDDLIPGIRLPMGQMLADHGPWSPTVRSTDKGAVPSKSGPAQVSASAAVVEPNADNQPASTSTRQQSLVDASDRVLLAWLHLSDLHFGHGDAEHGWDQKLVLQALRADVQKQVREGRVFAPNCILVTGDIAFSGATRRATEYADASEYLLALAADLQLSAQAVYLVPGNHDVQRGADQDRNLFRLLRDLRTGDESIDEAVGNPDDSALLRRRQANYWTFARSFAVHSTESSFHTRSDLRFGPLKVRILGLNTALLAADDQDRGRLRVGKGALAQLLSNPATEQELVIAMSHHPLTGGWLADEREVEAWLRRHAHIHLSGHVHEAASEHLRSGSGGELIRVTAGAAHGEKSPPGVPVSHGYNFASIVLTKDADLVLRIVPRRFSDPNKDFRADVDNVHPDHPYAEHLLRLPWPANEKAS